MEREFVSYNQALRLKVLGFDEPCFGNWQDMKEKTPWFSKSYTDNQNQYYGQLCSAPTFSQAFRWFREKHNLRGFIGFRPNAKQFDCHIYDMSLSAKEYVKQRTLEEFNKDPKFETYEEAELACLNKLIELIEK